MKVQLIEEAIRQGLGHLSRDGAFMVETGRHTGRAAGSRFIVRRDETEKTVHWGDTNKPMEFSQAKRLFSSVQSRLEKQVVYRVQAHCGPYPLEVVTTSPWHGAFAMNMFRHAPIPELVEGVKSTKKIRIWHLPYERPSQLGFEAPDDTLIVLDVVEMQAVIVGSAYAGEMKKSAFSLCNYQIPDEGWLPMHASANCLQDGSNSSVLFGLSGTGKTTLSAHPERSLIGDDEIIWSDRGLSNLEGGCYAKLIDLSEEKEPEIFAACNRFGAILENVGYDPDSRVVDYYDDHLTENTRGSYPLSALKKVFSQGREARSPQTIVFLTADAFGALPMVARLDEWQTQYHFISGYTAKVAGTEMGVVQPKATFSNCFGAPFMPRPVQVYAKMLSEKVKRAGASVWMLNTGWYGGHQDGQRFPLPLTRRILEMIQSGALDDVPMKPHPVFGFMVPVQVPGIEAKYLNIPEGGEVSNLAGRFVENMKKFGQLVSRELCERGGPCLSV